MEEARALLGVSRATFFNLARRHQLTRYQSPATGRRVFFERAAVERLRQWQTKATEGNRIP